MKLTKVALKGLEFLSVIIIAKLREAGIGFNEKVDRELFKANVEQPIRQYYISRYSDDLIKKINAMAN